MQDAVPPDAFFTMDLDAVYDEIGDEFDCREKVVHSQGNIGKAIWFDLGGHEYTGIFQGADTGFVRLSTTFPVVAPEDLAEGVRPMHSTMGLKFLRDGMDSANVVANENFAGGHFSYNFFEPSLTTVLLAEEGQLEKFPLAEDIVSVAIKPTTIFVHS